MANPTRKYDPRVFPLTDYNDNSPIYADDLDAVVDHGLYYSLRSLPVTSRSRQTVSRGNAGSAALWCA